MANTTTPTNRKEVTMTHHDPQRCGVNAATRFVYEMLRSLYCRVARCRFVYRILKFFKTLPKSILPRGCWLPPLDPPAEPACRHSGSSIAVSGRPNHPASRSQLPPQAFLEVQP